MSHVIEQEFPTEDRSSFQFSSNEWTGCGTLQLRSGVSSYPFRVRLLTREDLDELYALHQLILSTLPHPHVLRPDSRDFMERNLHSRGVTFGAYCRGHLISYSVLAFPSLTEESPSLDLPHFGIEPERIAVYDGSAVHPDFRGNYLHGALNRMRREYAVQSGHYHLMGTVSIFNSFSLSNHLDAGFFVKGIKKKYGDMVRLIIHQDTRATLSRTGPEEHLVALEDDISHGATIERGMWGFRASRHVKGSILRYGFFG